MMSVDYQGYSGGGGEAALARLDEVFDQLLMDMKPYVMSLPHREERQRCAVWIKKLCQCGGMSPLERKNRNSYAQLLFHMIKRGILDGPFAHSPKDGSLELLPSHASTFFLEDTYLTSSNFKEQASWPVDKEVLAAASSGVATHRTPVWVDSELDDTMASGFVTSSPKRSTHSHHQASIPKYSSADSGLNTRQAFVNLYNDPDFCNPSKSKSHDQYSSQTQMRAYFEPPYNTHGDENGMLNHPKQNENSMRIHEREMQVQKSIFESKLHEEKLKLQRQHDTAVQQILSRKNTEIEEMKGQFKRKITEMEQAAASVEARYQALQKETEKLKADKERHIHEVKEGAQRNLEAMHRDFERKTHEMMERFENDRVEIEKRHTSNIEELVEDTNRRLMKMESEYVSQQATTCKLIEELEARIAQMTRDAENMREEKLEIEKRKMELEYECKMLNEGFIELKQRLDKFEKKYVATVDNFNQEKRDTISKYETNAEVLRENHRTEVDKMLQSLSDMDQLLAQMKKDHANQLAEAERTLKDTTTRLQQDKSLVEQSYDKLIRENRMEHDMKVRELTLQIKRLEDSGKNKDDEIQKLMQLHKREMEQSERTFEDFKVQMDNSHSKLYEEMKVQMERIEQELHDSKELCAKHAKDYENNLSQIKQQRNKQIAELKLRFDAEKQQISNDCYSERITLMEEHDRILEELKYKMEAKLDSNEQELRTMLTKKDKEICELEKQAQDLREQVMESNSLRKQQLVEMGLLREEEKQNTIREKEMAIQKLKAFFESEKKQTQLHHSEQMERTIKQMQDSKQMAEDEYISKLKKSAETISELQGEIEQWRDETMREQTEHERKIDELNSQGKADLSAVKRDLSSKMNLLVNQYDELKSNYKSLERKFKDRESEHDRTLNKLQLEHNSKIKGMLPAAVRLELEGTIEALRSQVSSLQQTVLLLQGSQNSRLHVPPKSAKKSAKIT